MVAKVRTERVSLTTQGTSSRLLALQMSQRLEYVAMVADMASKESKCSLLLLISAIEGLGIAINKKHLDHIKTACRITTQGAHPSSRSTASE